MYVVGIIVSFIGVLIFNDFVTCSDVKEILIVSPVRSENITVTTTTHVSEIEETTAGSVDKKDLNDLNLNQRGNEEEKEEEKKEEKEEEKKEEKDEEKTLPVIKNSTKNDANISLNDYFAFIKDYPDYMEDEELEDEDFPTEERDEEVNITTVEHPIVFRQDCQCGLPTISRIVGGANTEIKKYPWNIQVVVRKNSYPFCGGTIINEVFVVTAAHCLEDLKASELGVRIGHTSSEDPGTVINVEHIRMHEAYRKNNPIIHDIGLIKLETALTFSDKVLPVCLLDKNNYQSHSAIVTGWGAVSEKGGYSDVLKAAVVQIYEYQSCRKISRYRKSHIHGNILCARRKSVDACQGDSGGPLVHYDTELQRFALIGITSYGIGCARFVYPGVYTKVPVYRSWILLHTENSTYCPV